MSQQINLLTAKRKPLSMAVWALAGMGAVSVGLLAYVQLMVAETARLSQAAAAGEQQVAQVKTAMVALQRQREGEGNAAALTAEIAALRPRAEAVGQLVQQLRSDSLGSPEGFARYFATLGSVSQEGLWLTGVTVTKSGSAVSISGRALRNEAVMQYVRRLNEAFGPVGVRFNSLELSPENLSKPGTGNAPGPTTVAFKLS